MADKIISTEELFNILDKYTFRQLHVHHTWKPAHSDFNDKTTFNYSRECETFM